MSVPCDLVALPEPASTPRPHRRVVRLRLVGRASERPRLSPARAKIREGLHTLAASSVLVATAFVLFLLAFSL